MRIASCGSANGRTDHAAQCCLSRYPQRSSEFVLVCAAQFASLCASKCTSSCLSKCSLSPCLECCELSRHSLSCLGVVVCFLVPFAVLRCVALFLFGEIAVSCGVVVVYLVVMFAVVWRFSLLLASSSCLLLFLFVSYGCCLTLRFSLLPSVRRTGQWARAMGINIGDSGGEVMWQNHKMNTSSLIQSNNLVYNAIH